MILRPQHKYSQAYCWSSRKRTGEELPPCLISNITYDKGKGTVYFVGALANVDSSILRMPIDHGFKIEDKSLEEGIRLISRIEGLPLKVVGGKLLPLACFNYSEKKYYFVTNSFKSDIKMNARGILTSFPMGVARFDNQFAHGYLNGTMRLMRLFKEGNIVVPLKYYYVIEKDIPRMLMGSGTQICVWEEPYELKPTEIPGLLSFIRNTSLPFSKSFLQLGFEAFELSYEANHRGLSFLSLMIGLEALLNTGFGELKYRVSRNISVLLGKTGENSESIFGEVKRLYDKRSKLVHTGKLDTIDEKDISRSRYYLRESIKEMSRMRKKKNEIGDLLNSCGFGKRPWKK